MSMQLSKNTSEILKNFASINQGITVKEGNRIRTCSVARNIVAEAVVDESFDATFSIYDLNEFLSTLSLFKEPQLMFDDLFVTVGEKTTRTKAKYFYSDPSVIIAPPDKNIELPSVDVEFDLSAETLSTILKASSVLGAPDIVVRGGNGILEILATDTESTASNSYAVTLDENYSGQNCNFIVKSANLKMIPDSYKAKLSKACIMHLMSTSGDIQYWIALEKKSTFGS